MDRDTARAQKRRGNEQPESQPKTEFGRRMWDLRQKILASGRGIETLEELEREQVSGCIVRY